MNFNSYSITDNALHTPIRPHKALIKSVKVNLGKFQRPYSCLPLKALSGPYKWYVSLLTIKYFKIGLSPFDTNAALNLFFIKKTTKNNLRIILKKNSCSTTSVFSFFYSSILPQNGTQGGTRFSKMAPKTVQNRFFETIHP